MATLRHWAPTPQGPRRCSMSDTVPIMSSTAGSLFWKKPLRKSGSCPRSRLPWGWRGRWDEGTKDSLRFFPRCPSPGPYPGLGAGTAPRIPAQHCSPTLLGSPQQELCPSPCPHTRSCVPWTGLSSQPPSGPPGVKAVLTPCELAPSPSFSCPHAGQRTPSLSLETMPFSTHPAFTPLPGLPVAQRGSGGLDETGVVSGHILEPLVSHISREFGAPVVAPAPLRCSGHCPCLYPLKNNNTEFILANSVCSTCLQCVPGLFR